MKHRESNIEAAILSGSLGNKRLREFGEETGLVWVDDPIHLTQQVCIDTVTCHLPVIPNQEFRVLIRGPKQDNGMDVCCYMDIDGARIASKSKLGNKQWQMIMDASRVSSTTKRKLKFHKICYSSNSERQVHDQAGRIQLDIVQGYRSAPTYDPILRFTHQESLWSTEIQNKYPVIGEASAYAPTKSKTVSQNGVSLAVSYGDEIESQDRRRKFQDRAVMCRFIFLYRDVKYIKSIFNVTSVTQPRLSNTSNEKSPIIIDDDDID